MTSGLHKAYLLLNDSDIRALHTKPELIGFPQIARMGLRPVQQEGNFLPLANPNPRVTAPARPLAPPRSETRIQRIECLAVCAMMAALCKSPRSVIPFSMEAKRSELGDRFQAAGVPMFSDLPEKEAGALGYVGGTIAGEAMWAFFSPYAGKNAVSPFTAALVCNLWIEDRLYIDRLQPDDSIRPDLSLDEGSIFREGGKFEAAWADFNELVLGLPNCPFHDERDFARIKRTASKLVGPMHERFQARGLFLSKEIPN